MSQASATLHLSGTVYLQVRDPLISRIYSCTLVSLLYCSLIPNQAYFSFYLFAYFLQHNYNYCVATTLQERMLQTFLRMNTHPNK